MPWQNNVALRCRDGLALNLPVGVRVIALSTFSALSHTAEVFPSGCFGDEACKHGAKDVL